MHPSPLALGLATVLWTTSLAARVTETTAYTKHQAFNAAVRFLRVDNAYNVTEKDPQLGYLLFRYPTGNDDKTTLGSVEVVQRKQEVLLIVRIPQLPSYHESLLARGLVEKLKADYGTPPKREKPPAEESDDEDDSPSPDEDAPPTGTSD